jgi:hypothetical protein
MPIDECQLMRACVCVRVQALELDVQAAARHCRRLRARLQRVLQLDRGDGAGGGGGAEELIAALRSEHGAPLTTPRVWCRV